MSVLQLRDEGLRVIRVMHRQRKRAAARGPPHELPAPGDGDLQSAGRTSRLRAMMAGAPEPSALLVLGRAVIYGIGGSPPSWWDSA